MGCQTKHSSQIPHQLCLFTDTNEHADMSITTTMRKMYPYAISTSWSPIICNMVLDDQNQLEYHDSIWEHIKETIRYRRSDLWIEQLSRQVKESWK